MSSGTSPSEDVVTVDSWRPGSFERRAGGFLIDAAVVFGLGMVVRTLLASAVRQMWLVEVLGSLVMAAVWLVMEVGLGHRWSATLGMRITRLAIERRGDTVARGALWTRGGIFAAWLGLSAALPVKMAGVALFAFCCGCMVMVWKSDQSTLIDQMSRTRIVRLDCADSGRVVGGQPSSPDRWEATVIILLTVAMIGVIAYMFAMDYTGRATTG